MDAIENKKPSPDQRRAAILSIAYREFMREGYSATSMSQIAALVGGSKATLYNYFPSKKDLFFAIAEREGARIFGQIVYPRDNGEPFEVTLVDLARNFLATLLSDETIAAFRLVAAESVRFPEVGRAAHDLAVVREAERLATYFRKAMERGALRHGNPRAAADLFFDLTTGMPHTQRLWNVVDGFSAKAIEAEARRVARDFLAVYGNDALSRLARQQADD